jgi:uncharacterized SAM-dependent methyltransferase
VVVKENGLFVVFSMSFFKNSEVAKKYGVHQSTVSSWIKGAKTGKNNLELIFIGENDYILDTVGNDLILEQLAKQGRKHKNKEYHKVIQPKPEFFTIFEDYLLSKLLIALVNHREIPHKFTYLNGGASYWQDYSIHSIEKKISNTVTNTIQMLDTSLPAILKRVEKGAKLNVIDIGVGDARPVKTFLAELLKRDLLHKYIAIDFSPEMLEIADKNIKEWFGDKIEVVKEVKDISQNPIDDILFYNSQNTDFEVQNLVLFLGSTIENQTDYYKTLSNLSESLTAQQDLLLLGETLDSKEAKTYFDLSADMTKEIDNQETWILELLNLTSDLYSVAKIYDDKDNSRKTQIVLNCDLTIEFKTDRVNTMLTFSKGERVTVWKHKHHNLGKIIGEFEKVSLGIENICLSTDKAQCLILGKLANDKW